MRIRPRCPRSSTTSSSASKAPCGTSDRRRRAPRSPSRRRSIGRSRDGPARRRTCRRWRSGRATTSRSRRRRRRRSMAVRRARREGLAPVRAGREAAARGLRADAGCEARGEARGRARRDVHRRDVPRRRRPRRDRHLSIGEHVIVTMDLPESFVRRRTSSSTTAGAPVGATQRRVRGAFTCDAPLVPDSMRGTCAPICPDGSPRSDGFCAEARIARPGS